MRIGRRTLEEIKEGIKPIRILMEILGWSWFIANIIVYLEYGR